MGIDADKKPVFDADATRADKIYKILLICIEISGHPGQIGRRWKRSSK
jgi:hypothetical protein